MKIEKYILSRIKQLKEDKDKASDPHDVLWYNRCIQELDWALQMNSKPTHNCYMGSKQISNLAW
tara:strand:- start:1051 stop:1242 length:192 start_codon:yes stop_codon:yes gene_type:complete